MRALVPIDSALRPSGQERANEWFNYWQRTTLPHHEHMLLFHPLAGSVEEIQKNVIESPRLRQRSFLVTMARLKTIFQPPIGWHASEISKHLSHFTRAHGNWDKSASFAFPFMTSIIFCKCLSLCTWMKLVDSNKALNMLDLLNASCNLLLHQNNSINKQEVFLFLLSIQTELANITFWDDCFLEPEVTILGWQGGAEEDTDGGRTGGHSIGSDMSITR